MIYGIPEQTNNTPQPSNGNVFNDYVMPSINVGLQAFQMYLTSKYGQQTTQQVVNNPNSQMAQDYWYMYQMSLMNQQQQQGSNNDMIKYIAIGVIALAAVFALTSQPKRR